MSTATLRRGSRGPEVRRIQEHLNARLQPSPGLRVDGDFGERTEAAVRRFQAVAGIGIDGVVGPRTWSRLESRAARPAPAPIPVTSPDAPWMAIAMREVGESEIAGSAHNPRILEYHATTGLRATRDETAWCSSFVNWCLRQVHIAGTNSAAAASWLGWGVPAGTRTGAITVLYNPAMANTRLSVSGNHVGFLVQSTGTHFVLLGGNQSDQVKISRYPKAAWQLKGHRWPSA